MSGPLDDDQAFTDFIVGLLKAEFPQLDVEIVDELELLVNKRRLDLKNLKRMAMHDPDRALEVVTHYLEQLLKPEITASMDVDFEEARGHIMPRIQPDSIFDRLDRNQVAYVPFVNNTSEIFVRDLPHMTISITTEQCVRWGVMPEDLEEIAQENLAEATNGAEIQFVASKEGGHAAIIGVQDGYDAARLRLSGLWSRLAPVLGDSFYAATPARDMFVAFSRSPEPFVRRLQKRITADFNRLPYPITDRLFLVVQDGVAGTDLSPAA